jgi:hypothetical protein
LKDYRLYHQYVEKFGLTFLPREIHEDTWEIATKLMLEALRHKGPAVTLESIAEGQYQVERLPDTEKPERYKPRIK